MTLAQELQQLGAPRKVVEAGEVIDRHVASGHPSPQDLVRYVTNWYNRNNTPNRYGK